MNRFLYFLGWSFSRIYLTLYHRFWSYGIRNVPRDRGALLASNHASYLDPTILGSGLPFPVWYLARTTLFERNKFFGWLIAAVNAIPLSRERLDLKTLRHVHDLCAKGKKVVIFPEGTRTPDGNLQNGLAGVGLFAEKVGVDIVPAYIHGTFDAFPRHRMLPVPKRVWVVYGTPMPLSTWQHIPSGRQRYQAIADDIMKAIRALKETHEKGR